jgi:hypothetical protein
MLSSPVSTSRTTVNKPSRNTAGRTVATKGLNRSCDCDKNSMATNELDSAMTYNVLRPAASETVELWAV